ncbi:MAG: hypothetical protein P4L83_21195 [Nevskia sp.]|nr:hypothetical protein [Nevskia sp.]
MPQIPEILSQARYDATPEPTFGLDATSQVSSAMRSGFGQVADAFATVAHQAIRQQDAVDTAQAFAKYQDGAHDLNQKWSEDTDPATVPDRFPQAQDDLRQQVLDTAPNDRVRQRLDILIDHAAPMFRHEVLHTAFVQQQQTNLAQNETTVSSLTQRVAQAPDPGQELVALDSIHQTVDAGVATHLYTPQQGEMLKSQALRTAILQRGVADPVGAKAMLDRYREQMLAPDALTADDRLKGPLNTATEWDLAQRSGRAVGGDYGDLVDFVKGQEGFQAAPFADGKQTSIGYGTRAQAGDTSISPEEADARLRSELAGSAARVDDAAARAGLTLNPNQRNALISFDYNTGAAPSVIGQAKGDVGALPGLMGAYTKQDGNELPGLVTRRAAEADMFGRPPGPTAGGRSAIAERIDWIKTQGAAQGLEPQVVQGAVAKAIQEESQARALQAGQLGQLRQDVQDLQGAYEAGVTNAPIPTDRIRALMDPPDADRVIQRLQISKDAGDLFNAVADMSPEEQQRARALLAVPGSLNATLPHKDGKTVLPAALPPGADETPEQVQHRLSVGSKLDALIARQQDMLRTDPAAYAAARPALTQQSAVVQQNPNDPAARQAYAAASLALQDHLGVPVDRQRVLTNAQSADLVATLKRTDPTKQDMGAALDGMASLYGQYWPKAQADLVRDGKLPAEWQVISAMDTPQQLVGRLNYQRALVEMSAAGGQEKYQAQAPASAVKDIRSSLDDTVAPFRETVWRQPGGERLFGLVRDAVQLQATRYAITGMDGGKALQQAYADLVDAKYDIDGSLRVPKGMLPAARMATDRVASGLQPDDLMPLRDPTGVRTPAETAAETLAAAKGGKWIPTPGDDGLMLLMRTRDSSIGLPALHRDGSPVVVRFADMPPVTAADVRVPAYGGEM